MIVTIAGAAWFIVTLLLIDAIEEVRSRRRALLLVFAWVAATYGFATAVAASL